VRRTLGAFRSAKCQPDNRRFGTIPPIMQPTRGTSIGIKVCGFGGFSGEERERTFDPQRAWFKSVVQCNVRKTCRHGKLVVWAASPFRVLPQQLKRSGTSGHTRPLRVTLKKVLARKWRPPFFLLPAAKIVCRHKSSPINDLCLQDTDRGAEKWRF
jgi:hypothetical protein